MDKDGLTLRWSLGRVPVGLLYILPSLLFVLIFFLIPLAMVVWMSLHDWPLLGQPAFSGLDNYASLLGDSTFWNSLWFTTKYTILVTPAIFICAFVLAHLINSKLRWVALFRTIYFLPVVIGIGTSSLLWVWLFNDQVGFFNFILAHLGVIKAPVLTTPSTSLAGVIVMVVWKTVGFTMVLLLVGMQAIPTELYEAAKIDGATWWSTQFFITVPLLRRTIALALIISVVGSFLAFDQFFIMTGGGPNNSTITVVYWIYRASFTYFKLGYGSALSLLLMLILTAISVLQLLVLREPEKY
ncbi:MAG: sugar ABC transporter permease [Verrucomicrobia bacterium]|nr:sugar ABC transporter permease [Verrucomicrobiota bacterium]